MLHSFSVLDIQKMRNNLKSSKSYPHDLKEKVSEEEEEEDGGRESADGVGKAKEATKAPGTTASKVVVKPAATVVYSSNRVEPTAITSGAAAAAHQHHPAETRKPESQLINVRTRERVGIETFAWTGYSSSLCIISFLPSSHLPRRVSTLPWTQSHRCQCQWGMSTPRQM